MTLHPKAVARAAEVQAIHGIPFRAIRKADSRREIVDARQHYWWLLTKRDGFSLARAGRVTGHHYTTVLYGVRQFEARSAQEEAA